MVGTEVLRSAASASCEEPHEPQLVINELLAYAFDELKRSPCNDVKAQILRFYCASSISSAKHMLWEKFSSSLSAFAPRRDTAKRVAAEADLDDIMAAVAKIDSQCDGKEPHIIFVVKNVRNVPPPSERMNSWADADMILRRLDEIEKYLMNPHGHSISSNATASRNCLYL